MAKHKTSNPSASSIALAQIANAMSGVEWDKSVMNDVADILHKAGFEIQPPDAARLPPAKCPNCGDGDHLVVREESVTFYPYHAQRHVADEGGSDTEPAENSDLMGKCESCGHADSTEAFGMKLLDWVDTSDDDDDDEEGDDDVED